VEMHPPKTATRSILRAAGICHKYLKHRSRYTNRYREPCLCDAPLMTAVDSAVGAASSPRALPTAPRTNQKLAPRRRSYKSKGRCSLPAFVGAASRRELFHQVAIEAKARAETALLQRTHAWQLRFDADEAPVHIRTDIEPTNIVIFEASVCLVASRHKASRRDQTFRSPLPFPRDRFPMDAPEKAAPT
jgi:hypothetical protein